MHAKVLEYWSPAHVLEGYPGKEVVGPAELRKPADEVMEFSTYSSMGSESEVEITGASGPPTAAAPKRKTCRVTRKILLSKAGLTVAERSLRSSTPKGASKVRGASAPPVTAGEGSAVAGPQAEKEAIQGLSQMHEEVTLQHSGLGTKEAAPLKLNFMLRRSGG